VDTPASLVSSGWAGRGGFRGPGRNRALLAEVVERIAAGDLAPVEPVSYPLHDAARALRDLADRKVAGKVALVPGT
jgi:NADPH2:quinone reductase